RDSILDLVIFAGDLRRGIGGLEARLVVWMYECHSLSWRPWLCPWWMSVNLAMPAVALEVSRLKIETPDAELASRQCQLQPIAALGEGSFLTAPLREKCGENERAN